MVRVPASLAAALLTAAPLGAQQATPQLAPGEALVQVDATGEIKAVPDIATVETGVTSEGGSAKAALAANAARAQRLIDALRAAGVADAAIRTSSLTVRPRYRPDKDGNDSREVIGYRAANRLTARIAARDAGRIVDALAAAGATEIDGPNFDFADESPLRRRARDAAVREAQQRARDYADAFGMKTLRVVRVSERRADIFGGSDIVVTAAKVASPVEPGEQSVTVNVWLDFAMSR